MVGMKMPQIFLQYFKDRYCSACSERLSRAQEEKKGRTTSSDCPAV